MIDIIYLKSAAEIRRKYLKASNNISLYQQRAKSILDVLNKSLEELNDLQNDLNGNNNVKDSIDRLMKIIDDVEQEGIRLEKMIEPMNKEMESLSKEEGELYRQIKEKYPTYTDENIIKTVKEYLLQQGI